MTDTPSGEEVPRPRPGCFLLLVPVVAITAMFAAYFYLFASAWMGRPAEGERVAIAFRGCAEARGPIEARVAEMGLADTVFRDEAGGFVVETRLPDDDRVADGIPTVLSRPGRFSVRSGDAELIGTDGVGGARVRLDLFMIPTLVVDLTAAAAKQLDQHRDAHPDGELALWVDDEQLVTQPNRDAARGPELEIALDAADDRARMERTAALSIVVGHGPLPCPVTVAGVTPLAE